MYYEYVIVTQLTRTLLICDTPHIYKFILIVVNILLPNLGSKYFIVSMHFTHNKRYYCIVSCTEVAKVGDVENAKHYRYLLVWNIFGRI